MKEKELTKVKKTYVEFEEIKFNICKDKKTIACVIKTNFCPPEDSLIYNTYIPNKGNFGILRYDTFVGIAKCHPNDTFNETIGKRIAESKAKAEAFKWANRIMKDFNTALLLNFGLVDSAIAKNCFDAYQHELEHIKYLQKNNK